VIRSLEVDPGNGLSSGQVRRARSRYGKNRVRRDGGRSAWGILADQFKSLIMLLLGGASALSFAFSQWVDGTAIAVAMLINAVVGFVTELQAVRSMEALQEMSRMTARVRRGGRQLVLPAEELVPGDLVLLESGDVLPADIRLTESNGLQSNESALTGESVPVAKSTDPVPEEAVLTERSSMLFKGTAVTRGSGAGVVTATGMDTELGTISSLVREAEEGSFPLERRLNRLGRNLIWVVVAIASAAGGIGILSGRELFLMIETSVALMVAAIPEGLLIVATVALARGMHRMARRNALVRHLSAVETLGSTTDIFTDKTGTLTENRMRVTVLCTLGGDFQVERLGEQEVRLAREGETVEPGREGPLGRIIRVGVLCNNASLGEGGEAIGDPMEAALLDLGSRLGVEREDLLEGLPEVREVAFDPDVMMMATYHREEGGYRVAVKGAAERVLGACTRLFREGEWRPLDEAAREELLGKNRDMAGQGLRVLAFAEKAVSSPEEEPYRELGFLGMAGMLDPPRDEVKESIDRCKAAGIRVVMVTGDQEATALDVARAVGLGEGGRTAVVHGGDLKDPEEMTGEERDRALSTDIFVRMSPEQKLHLIGLRQDAGRVVAMTGDGVNDAPALKKANIGIAMGRRGQQVAREAADVILQDDSFHTITVAIEQGRGIFNNIRRFVIYLLSGNIGEILMVTAGLLLGTPVPLLPLQILYLNAINDAFPALALGLGEAERDVMHRPPRDPSEPILQQAHWWSMAGYGALIAAAAFTAFLLALNVYRMGPPGAVTVSFLTLAFARLWHVFNMKDPAAPLLRNQVTGNRFVWGALVLCTGLILLAVYIPGLSGVLDTARPGPAGWMLAGGMSLVPLVLGQAAHLALRRR
jgi:Ca2+-transporting ATPase